MRVVIPGTLWLGNAADARNLPEIMEAGILAIVDLALEERGPTLPRSAVYCRFPIVDGENATHDILRIAIETVASLLKRRIPTLVFCRAGMSRSPSVVAAALSIAEGGSPEHCLQQVIAGHPHDVSPQFWSAVRQACEEIRQGR